MLLRNHIQNPAVNAIIVKPSNQILRSKFVVIVKHSVIYVTCLFGSVCEGLLESLFLFGIAVFMCLAYIAYFILFLTDA